ncbi:MAG: putative transporter, periplasmic substrate-binding protein [Proteobacteria bacterium]|nr:putative transporter, periplasmic substrate-binding protein [Pseudomonadota bacterium]
MKPGPLLSLLLAFSVSGLAAEPPAELTIFYYERMPFYGDRDGKPAGLLIDISRLILDQAGIKYRLVNVPVIRFFESLKKPGNSCLIGALKTKEREVIYAYSDDYIYRDQPFRIIVNKSKRKALPERPSIKQVLESELRLGVSDGYVYGDWLDRKIIEYQPKLQKINIGNDSEKMHKMMIGGRFDYMFAVAEEARHIVSEDQEHSDNLTTVEIADAPRGNMRYLLCSKEIDSAIMQKINAAIKAVKSTPDYERLANPPN